MNKLLLLITTALLLQIIPANILSPFVKTDFLQIVILALAFGIALVYMHEKMQPLLDILQLAEEFFIKLMVYLCRYLPYLIYLTLFNVVLTTEVGKLLAVPKNFAGLSLPLGQALYQTGTMLCFVSLAIVALIFLDYPSTMLNVLGNDVLCLCSASDLHKLKKDI